MKPPIIQSTFISANAPFATSTAVILGCPFDGTASFRPGARFGPSAIRRASWGMETYSPYLKRDLTQLRIHDMGDLELPLGEKDLSLTMIREAVRRILLAKKFPIFLGGDDLISLPAVQEVLQAYPHLHIVHIDAHTDLRENYLGEVLSHSTVMNKIADRLQKRRLFQIGALLGVKPLLFTKIPSRPPLLLADNDADGRVFLTLLISLPNSFGITQLPLGGFLPPGILTASQAFDRIFRPQVFQDTSDHIHADIRALVLKFCYAERSTVKIWGQSSTIH